MRITNSEYQPAIKTNNVNFQGISFPKFFATPKTTLTLSREAKLNKASMEWLNSHLKGQSQESIKKAYNSCLNSDNNVCEQAIGILKKYIPQKTFFGSMFNSQQKPNVYSKFGLDFMSIMLEGSKNDKYNHTKENLDFLDVVLEKYDRHIPKYMLDMIVKSKVKDGNVLDGAAKIFENLYKPKVGRNDDLEYWDFLYDLKDKTEHEKKFLINNVIKNRNFRNISQMVDYAKGKDSKKILELVNEDLEKYDSSDVRSTLIYSKDYYGKHTLENYITQRPYINSKNIPYYNYASDINGRIVPEVVDLINVIIDKNSLKKVQSLIDLTKNKDRTFNIDAVKYLTHALTEDSSPNDYNDIAICTKYLKNKNGDIQFKLTMPLRKAWLRFKYNAPYNKQDMFPAVIKCAKDKDGNFIPEILNEYPKLFDDGLSVVTPNIIKLSKFDDKFKKDNFDKIVKLLKSADKSEQEDLSKFLYTCLDKNNNLDETKTKIFDKIQKRGIHHNVMKIAIALQDPDKTFSHSGLDLAEHLVKNGNSDTEKDIPSILEACRDKTGYLNANSMYVAKNLQKLNRYLTLSKLIKVVQNNDKEIDTNKTQVIAEILKAGKIKSVSDLEAILKLSTDRNSVVDLEVLKRLSQLASQGEILSLYEDVIPAYRKLYKYEHATHLSQLNLNQKRTLMQALQRYGNQIQTREFNKLMSSKLLPQNNSEYCSMMGRLSHAIGINITKLPSGTIQRFYKAMENLADNKQGFMHLNFDKETPVLNLSYSLKDFKNDVWKLVRNAHYSDRTKALDYFGFELKSNDGKLELTGYPTGDKPDGRLAHIKDKDVLNLIKKVNPYVVKFTENNAISIKDHPNIASNLTEIVTAFPEFLTTIGKKQHGTHDFTLDVHLLKVLQGVMQNPEYEKLSSSSKKHIQLAALLHDITKAEGRPDFDHPRNSAFDVYYLLDKLGLSEREKLKIYHIIKNHDWLAKYDFSSNDSKRIAFHLREGNAFKLCSMLTEADLKGVQKNDRFYDKHSAKLYKARKEISKYLYELQSTSINLPQSKIPKASELNRKSTHVRTIKADGITNTVLDLSGCHDLGNVGFKTCKSLNDFNVLVHGLDCKNSASMFQALGLIDSNALLSSSYVVYSKGNYKAFRKEGFILDVPAANTHVAYWRDFGSGYKKSTKDLYNTYLFHDNTMRNYISDKLKAKLHLSNKEYIALFKKIEDLPLEKLEAYEPKVAKAYREIFRDMEVSKRGYGRNYNEILVTNPKIQGIFCYNQTPENVSSYLRKYAERNNIPIIIFG